MRRAVAARRIVRRGGGEEAFASLALPLVLWTAMLIFVVMIDIGAYLVAASRAQAAADAAALAAVSADAPAAARSPSQEAERVVRAADARLEGCACVAGAKRSQVTVSVDVAGLVIPSLGAGRVSATAEAVLLPPDPLPTQPTANPRVRWERR